MTDLIKRSIHHVIAALVSLASRLARVAMARELIDSYATAYEEAARLEASGKPQLAKFLRAELEATLAAPDTAGPTPPPALNGDSTQHPFALPRPDTTATEPAGEGSEPPRRRGRRPRTSAPAQDSSMDSPGEPVWPPAAPPPIDGAGPTATIPDPRRRFE